MAGSKDSEERLLARLKALRQSSTSAEETLPPVTEDALSVRLRALRNGSSGEPLANADGFKQTAADQGIASPDTTSTFRDEVEDVLRSSRDAQVSKKDLDEAHANLSLADGLLKSIKDGDAADREKTLSRAGRNAKEANLEHQEDEVTEEDIDRLLAELNIENNGNGGIPSGIATPDSNSKDDRAFSLVLPDTPLDLKASPAKTNDLSLPSVPASAPQTGTGGGTGRTLNTTGSSHHDNDVDSWCVICCDDAVLRCLGCDGELYCVNCWNEGHRGPDVGFEERRHKAITFTRSQKKPQIALA